VVEGLLSQVLPIRRARAGLVARVAPLARDERELFLLAALPAALGALLTLRGRPTRLLLRRLGAGLLGGGVVIDCARLLRVVGLARLPRHGGVDLGERPDRAAGVAPALLKDRLQQFGLDEPELLSE